MLGDSHSELVAFVRATSRILGWGYFLAWSLSFYPQPMLNWQRRSTHGFTPDYSVANVFGFVSYTTSNSLFYFSPLIRSQYAARHPTALGTNLPDRTPTVRLNDVVYAAHALTLCLITYSQFFPALWGFEEVPARWSRPRVWTLAACWAGPICVAIVFCLALCTGDPYDATKGWAWIDVVYTISYIKLALTTVKYIPQVWANYQNKNTVGWSVGQILLDSTGSFLSIAQIVLDSSLEEDWSGITGNFAKLGLGNISLFFDIIYLFQECVVYRRNNKNLRLESRRASAASAASAPSALANHTSRTAEDRASVLRARRVSFSAALEDPERAPLLGSKPKTPK